MLGVIIFDWKLSKFSTESQDEKAWKFRPEGIKIRKSYFGGHLWISWIVSYRKNKREKEVN